ncbi:hypothetical protein ACJW30_04G006800 [Castanea mollissima]
MALNSRVLLSALFCIIFVWSFLETSNGLQSDIDCLKSIKHSLEDPSGNLSSWDFSNNTVCSFPRVDCWLGDGKTVVNLRLSNMGLRGQFPRGIKNCTSLTGLNLSNNKLSGPLPFDIAELVPFVTILDLSGNNFSGEIPKNIVNCSYLNVLKLDHNQLTGQIPPELGLLSRIKAFSVSDNMLSGVVPNLGYSNIQADSFANNKGLCGGPLNPCTTPKRGLKFDFSFKEVRRRHCQKRGPVRTRKKKLIKFISRKLGLLQEATKKNSHLEGMVTKMNFQELSEATNNFSSDNAIGLGKMGVMYKAVLPNGSPLAVKRLHGCQSFEKNFICELLALGRLRHNNIIPLLGFCREKTEKLLVYQYISNSNLYDWLHAKQGNDKILEWPLRIKIVIGIARGLAWLHHKWDFRVVHLNLSSNSILLDKNFVPKISNFRGAKISSSEGMMFIDSNDTNSSNSSFVDSGVWELGFVKKDVYDFGILLLELIIGKEPVQINNFSNSLNGSLADWITHLLSSSSDLCSVIDKSLIGRGFDGEIFQFLRIACTCLNFFPSQRPTMFELYNTLSTLGERYGITNDSELLSQTEIATASTSNEIVSVGIA